MSRKFMAAVLLVTIAAWVEMTLAPLLVMDHSHVHATGAGTVAVHAMEHHDSAMAGHACCPGLHANPSVSAPAEVAFVSEKAPCENQHRCCFRQIPSGSPAPTRPGGQGSSASSTARTTKLPSLEQRQFAVCANSGLAKSPPDQFNTVLRI